MFYHLRFWGICVLFFMVAMPLYISTSSAKGFPSNRCEVISHCDFLFAFPSWLVIWSVFSCTSSPFEYFLWKTGYSYSLAIFKLDYYYLLLSCMSSLYILDINPISGIMNPLLWNNNKILWVTYYESVCGLQIVSPILLVSFSFCWLFLSLCKSFLVWCSTTCLFLHLLCMC